LTISCAGYIGLVAVALGDSAVRLSVDLSGNEGNGQVAGLAEGSDVVPGILAATPPPPSPPATPPAPPLPHGPARATAARLVHLTMPVARPRHHDALERIAHEHDAQAHEAPDKQHSPHGHLPRRTSRAR